MTVEKRNIFQLAHLLNPASPWVLCITCDPIDPIRMEQVLAQELGITARVLNGTRTVTGDGLFNEFASRFNFPAYFGYNWDALKDCLSDLEWLPGFAYAAVIDQAFHLLEREPEEKLKIFVDVMQNVAREWATPVDDGEYWDRPEVPFHILLQASAEQIPALKSRYRSIGVVLADLEMRSVSLLDRSQVNASPCSSGRHP
jgi:hypothetical protein